MKLQVSVAVGIGLRVLGPCMPQGACTWGRGMTLWYGPGLVSKAGPGIRIKIGQRLIMRGIEMGAMLWISVQRGDTGKDLQDRMGD